MPNLGAILKDEIRRLARREIRAAITSLKGDNAALKKAVARLKRQTKVLERDSRLLMAAEKRLREKTTKSRAGSEELEKFRISGKGVRSLRKKLGISQRELAILVGVSGQSVFLWEQKAGGLRLRDDSKVALLELRGIGAREARRRLAEAG